MIDAALYGNEPSYNSLRVNKIISEMGMQTKYEVSLVSDANDSFISIKENGNIDMFVDHMLGIKIDKENNSITMVADSTNIKSDLNVNVPKTNASFSIYGDEKDSFLSQNADYIGINSNRRTFIGTKGKAKNSSVNLVADTINVTANKFMVNGKEIK